MKLKGKWRDISQFYCERHFCIDRELLIQADDLDCIRCDRFPCNCKVGVEIIPKGGDAFSVIGILCTQNVFGKLQNIITSEGEVIQIGLPQFDQLADLLSVMGQIVDTSTAKSFIMHRSSSTIPA